MRPPRSDRSQWRSASFRRVTPLVSVVSWHGPVVAEEVIGWARLV